MDNTSLICVFEDTIKHVMDSNNLLIDTKLAMDNTEVIFPEDELTSSGPYINDTEINVVNMKSFEAARKYADNYTTCVLNFANPVSPGGGVLNGATAQEEDLCRASNLYFSLNSMNALPYYYHNEKIMEQTNYIFDDSLIYTKSVTVLRDDTTGLFLEDSYMVDVITCAAPMCCYNNKVSDSDLHHIMKPRILRILQAADHFDAEVLILGAFGCGAFACNPNVVADCFKEAIKGKHAFNKIIFAIWDPNDEGNCGIFYSKLKSLL